MKNALITGAAGGMGFTTAKHLAENGWQVFAADLNRERLDKLAQHTHIEPFLIDVSDRQSVENAYRSVAGSIEHLDAIVNFAGILRVGSVAEISEQVLTQLLNINLLGTYRINQVFLPLLNSKQKGRIINISSEVGWQSGGPFNGSYAMSKHAIEAYSDSLRRELMFLGIPVIKIQPGPFKTDMVASIEKNFSEAIDQSTLFKPQLSKIKRLALQEQNKAHPPEIIAHTVLHALTVGKPKAAYSVKPDLTRALLDYIPVSWSDWLLKQVLGS